MKQDKIILCRTTWMKEYNGITNGDVPFNYLEDTYNSKTVYTGEIYNFQEFNGKCYGYIEGYGNTHIENYFKTYFEDKELVNGCTIVWCAFDSDGHLKIVGWYKSACVYRNHRYLVDFFPEDSDDNGYDCVADCDNTFLLPSEQRDFRLDTHLNKSQLEYIKMSPLLYPKKTDSKLILNIKNYIDNYKGEFSTAGIMKKHIQKSPLEILTYEQVFYTAQSLQELNCFTKAVEFYAKALELDNNNTEPLVNILICYAKSGDVQNTLNIAKKLIKLLKLDKNFKKSEWLVDAYFILSNVYVYMNQFNDARNTIKKVLDIKNEAYDKAFVQDVLDIIEEVEEDYFYKM